MQYKTTMKYKTNPHTIEYVASDEPATRRLGAELGRVLQPGAVVALCGELGSGKTRLVQGIGQGLGIPAEQIVSPTFVLIHEHRGRLPLYHCDVYRITPEEFLDLGPDEYFEGDGITVIEWADRVARWLPQDRIEVRIEPVSEWGRRFTLTAFGPRSNGWIEALRSGLDRQDSV